MVRSRPHRSSRRSGPPESQADAVDLQRAGRGRLRIGTVAWMGDFVAGAGGVGIQTTFGGF